MRLALRKPPAGTDDSGKPHPPRVLASGADRCLLAIMRHRGERPSQVPASRSGRRLLATIRLRGEHPPRVPAQLPAMHDTVAPALRDAVPDPRILRPPRTAPKTLPVQVASRRCPTRTSALASRQRTRTALPPKGMRSLILWWSLWNMCEVHVRQTSSAKSSMHRTSLAVFQQRSWRVSGRSECSRKQTQTRGTTSGSDQTRHSA